MNETWLPIPGWDGFYEVSDQGRVRSLDRQSKASRGSTVYTRTLRGTVLRPGRGGSGRSYATVKLCGVTRMVHQLVVAAFVGPRPADKPHIRHLNGDSLDNRLSNLKYGTVSENQRDRIAHGNNPFLNRTHCPQRHEYTPENLRADKRNSRQCRLCHRASEARRRARKRAAALQTPRTATIYNIASGDRPRPLADFPQHQNPRM